MKKVEFETVLANASQLPLVRIDRESFLRKEFSSRYSSDIVEKAIKYNPGIAGIPVEVVSEIAQSSITAETNKVTLLSAASGIPGGLAVIGTVPADLAQYFGHILRVLQELLYLYGWPQLEFDSDEMTEETKNILTLFTGVMFGVEGAVTAVNQISKEAAKQAAKQLPKKPLTKGVIYPIVKKVCAMLGIKITKETFAKGIAKLIPGIGAVVSGGLTYFSFKPMAERLRTYLVSCDTAKGECYGRTLRAEPYGV